MVHYASNINNTCLMWWIRSCPKPFHTTQDTYLSGLQVQQNWIVYRVSDKQSHYHDRCAGHLQWWLIITLTSLTQAALIIQNHLRIHRNYTVNCHRAALYFITFALFAPPDLQHTLRAMYSIRLKKRQLKVLTHHGIYCSNFMRKNTPTEAVCTQRVNSVYVYKW